MILAMGEKHRHPQSSYTHHANSTPQITNDFEGTGARVKLVQTSEQGPPTTIFMEEVKTYAPYFAQHHAVAFDYFTFALGFVKKQGWHSICKDVDGVILAVVGEDATKAIERAGGVRLWPDMPMLEEAAYSAVVDRLPLQTVMESGATIWRDGRHLKVSKVIERSPEKPRIVTYSSQYEHRMALPAVIAHIVGAPLPSNEWEALRMVHGHMLHLMNAHDIPPIDHLRQPLEEEREVVS